MAPDPFTLLPFVIVRANGRQCIAATLNPPPIFDFRRLVAWYDAPESDVLLIDGATGAVELLGYSGSCIVGPSYHGAEVALFTDGRRFAWAWAANRRAYVERYRAACVPSLPFTEPPDCGLPGLVLAGQLTRVTPWTPLQIAHRVRVDNPTIVPALSAALVRAAGVPMIEAAQPRLGKVA